jgi:heme-degrading monooxygenase HmoA
MVGAPVVRMWITNKNDKVITAGMNESMEDFLSIAIQNGCIGSTFAEDEERIIVYTRWMDEMTLEQFRSSEDYKTKEGSIIQSFIAAGFEIPDDIMLNSTAKILFSN